MQKQNVKHSKVIIALFALSLAAFLAVFGWNIALESSVTPKGGLPEAVNGVGFESLTGGDGAFLQGGKSSREIAAALTGGKTERPKSSISVMKITSYGSDEQGTVTVLKDEKGNLFSLCPDGTVRKVDAAKLKKLLEQEELTFLGAADSPVAIFVNGEEVPAYNYDITTETLFGSSELKYTAESVQQLLMETGSAPATSGLLPEDSISVTFGESEVFCGNADTLPQFAPAEDGSYLFTVDRIAEGGSIQYRFSVDYSFTPAFNISRVEVPQGGLLLVTIANTNGREVSAVTNFDYTAGMITSEDEAWCYIPVSHTIPSGAYNITVSCGAFSRDFPITVTKEAFEEQHLTIDEDTVSSTTGEDASREFAEAMAVIYKNFDPVTYWSGTFIQPVEGSITTQYGLYRYTNGSETPTRHAGIDIAADAGTAIKAPAAGKVIFSGHLTVSGNTVVIEHGNGLHSLFFHMQENSCSVGDLLLQGDTVGLLGSTGYSSGPHLHYQLMIGDSSINPWRAFDGTAEFYRIHELGLANSAQ